MFRLYCDGGHGRKEFELFAEIPFQINVAIATTHYVDVQLFLGDQMDQKVIYLKKLLGENLAKNKFSITLSIRQRLERLAFSL